MIGYKYFCEKGVLWRENQGGIFPLSPPCKLPGIEKTIARRMMSESDCLFIRWESHFDQLSEGSWWHVIKDAYDELETLPKKTRYMVRKASKNYEAHPICAQDVIELGYQVYESAYQRYDTHEPMLTYEDFFNAIRTLPGSTEFWGVYEKETGSLVGFSENYIEDNTCFYVTMWLEPKSMSSFSGYLLFHKMELHYLRDRGLLYISDGARSISHDTNIHNFLIGKFRFRKAYAHLNVIYTPWLSFAVSIAYPFRRFIKKLPFSSFQKISILLRQEEIRRSTEKELS